MLLQITPRSPLFGFALSQRFLMVGAAPSDKAGNDFIINRRLMPSLTGEEIRGQGMQKSHEQAF